MTALGLDALLVARFRSLITHHLGLRFEDNKLGWLSEVLRRRLDASLLDSEIYLARLEIAAGTGPESVRRELAELARELTVGETYFFRNREQFLALQEHAVPQRLAAWPGRRSLRILSAGCASGEEPYSIAMTLHALLDNPAYDLAIHAVDLNPQVLEKARRGRYTAWSLRDTPATLKQRWFRQEGEDLVLDETVRAAVTFEERNLSLDDDRFWRPDLYDIVFCRNVLMYFAPAIARAAMARITRALTPGGYLFLGHAETMRSLSQDYELCHSHDTFYYQRLPAAPHIGTASGTRLPALPMDAADLWPELSVPADTWFQSIGQAAERIRLLTAPTGPATGHARPVGANSTALVPAMNLLRQERFAQALAVVQSLPPLEAHQPDALLLHGVLLAHGSQFDEASRICHQLLAIDAAHAGAHYVLALCREGVSDPAGAVTHHQTAIALDPAFAMPRLHLGLLAQRAGDLATVRHELGHALMLLAREDESRLLLFGGGFHRDALLALCRAGLQACGGMT